MMKLTGTIEHNLQHASPCAAAAAGIPGIGLCALESGASRGLQHYELL